MSFIKSIRQKIENALHPEMLQIINESHLHAGHQEQFDGTGETHLRLHVVSEAFNGKSRVERHRMINDLVSEEMQQGLHAIAIDAKAPRET